MHVILSRLTDGRSQLKLHHSLPTEDASGFRSARWSLVLPGAQSQTPDSIRLTMGLIRRQSINFENAIACATLPSFPFVLIDVLEAREQKRPANRWLKRPAPRALCEFALSFPASFSLAAVSFSREVNRSYLKNVRRSFWYSKTSMWPLSTL